MVVVAQQFQDPRAISTVKGRRVLIALPGLHRVVRGAETALEAIGRELARLGHRVTLIGSGEPRREGPYRFLHAGCVGRRWFKYFPSLPYVRTAYAYEELTFAPNLWRRYVPDDYDVTVTCGFPYCNRVLRRKPGRRRPVHVFVTQNGDHMAQATQRDYRAFACDGLVCTNNQYFERNRGKFRCKLIPNGVDPNVFLPGAGDRGAFGLPEEGKIALMVSALIESKRIREGIEAAAKVEGLNLVVAGDGEMRGEVEAFGKKMLGERFFLVSLPREKMPALYRSADVFLHMSTTEASANAYIEALASGLPIVTHDWEVTRWTLEDAAILVNSLDLAAVADGLRRAMTNGADVGRQREMVERRFSWASIGRQYAEFFDEVLAAV